MSDSTTPQDDAAMSPASTGSVAAAWMVTLPGRHFSYTTDNYEKAVFCHREESGSEIITLYRSPQPTLSDAEREAVSDCIKFAFPAIHPAAATLRGLLERTAQNKTDGYVE